MAQRRIVVVHAGFHKTGTTSVQALLRQHGKQIWPQHALVLPPRIPSILRVATLHSALRDPLSLNEFAFRLKEFLATLDLGKKRGLCISAEDLAGLIPGRNGHPGYEATPTLMATMARCLKEALGDEIELTFFFSTRAAEAWLRSTYWQNLRGSRLTERFESYAEPLAECSDLEAIVQQVRDKVSPHRVISRPLEETRDLPLGPGEPILDLLELHSAARAEIKPVKAYNAAPPDKLVDAVLRLNRSNLDDESLAREKAQALGRFALKRDN
ncbi:hypothetical protein [Flavimaricola marinus]|uniref:Stf0 sulfotransferase n=1 Tax=Flavimaricola marinus TaxID=1819565 RepID=A0A238L972_9RHOB|nr:hypothetical protein [Flavimaricola marinus]SMY06229.1 hypothetical protein LOM8899_00352 [Flavimaricola marinus]